MVLGAAVSLNLIPGYDFTVNEMVTKDKLTAWIAGLHNLTGDPTATDLGLVFPDIAIVATMTTGVTEGSLALDVTTGMLSVYTRWGYTPFAGTKGAQFVRRVKAMGYWREGIIGPSRFFNTLAGPSMFYSSEGVAFPVSTYSAGRHLEGFGADTISDLVWSLPGSGYGYLQHLTMWPDETYPFSIYGASGAASNWRPMVAIGGWVPIFATCATLARTNQYQTYYGDLIIAGATTAEASMWQNMPHKFDMASRNGCKLGPNGSHHYAFLYPTWNITGNVSAARWF
jgi:hypothetical protein